MERNTPPKKPVYPKQETPHRGTPQRPVYTYSADVPRQPRKPASGRIVYDYEKTSGASVRPSTDTGATPFVNTVPPPAQQPAQRRAPGQTQAPHAAGTRRAPRREEPRWRALPEQETELKPRPGVYDQNADRRHRPPDTAPNPGTRRRAGARQKRPERTLTPGEARRRRIRRRLLAGLLAAVLLAAGIFATMTVLFKIQTVTVEAPEGGFVYDDAQITAAFGQPVGANLFGFSTAEAQQTMEEALPYLEQVQIKRRLPDTVVISAVPAQEMYTVESASGWAVLSQNYKVLRVEEQAPLELMRIDGVQADAPVPGQPVQFVEADKLEILQTLLQKAQDQGLGPITQVDLTNTLELSVLYQDRIRIVLGTTNDLDYKIKWAWEMVTPGQTSDSLAETERGTLDVSSRGEDGLGRALWRAGVL